ncbi:MAG: hypothetical protein ABIQ84_07550 [Usitatibacter sp.]
MRRRAHAAAGLAALALAASLPALGCGYCIEDRMAAVYDHRVITDALDKHHRIAFFALEGTLPPDGQARRVVAGALRSTKGVDSQSLRISVASASLSLAYDGQRISSARIVEILNRKFAARGMRVALLKGYN